MDRVAEQVAHASTEAQRQAMHTIAQRCRTDLFYLCKYILGYDLMTEATHGQLCRYAESLNPHSTPEDTIHNLDYKTNNTPTPPTKILENVKNVFENTDFDPNKKFLMLLMPRGSFKSSVVTIGFSIQTILNDPNSRILIDSETFSKSKAFLAEIKGHLTDNDKFREIYHSIHGVYPDAKKKDDLWTDSQLNVAGRTRQRKEPTFSCAGIDVTKTGMHYDLIVADDLMSEKNITSKEQIDQVVQHYKLALSLLDPGKPLIVIGTRWDYNDVYQYILDRERKRFNILVEKATRDDGSLFFPERLTKEFLQAQKESQGSYVYSCQYQNSPVDNETATFKRSQLIRKEWNLVVDRPMNWYLSVDPSFEGPYSDYAAFVLAGMDFQRDMFVRHVLRAKMTYSQIIANMFDLYLQFKPKQILLETIASAKSIEYELNNEQKRRGVWLPVTKIQGQRKSKEERIRGLAPYYEFGHIFHISECAQLDDLEYELIHFPRGTHDDIIDALASVLEVANPPHGAGAEMSEKTKRIIDASVKPRSPITNY